MAVPKSKIWDLDLHSRAKHGVLERYYDAWYPIMLGGRRRRPRLTVFDGYAGPGEYSKGEEGSPMIALRRLLDRPHLLSVGTPVRFVFVEERKDRLEHLRSLVSSRFPHRPGHVGIDFVLGSCEAVWEEALTDARAWGQPIFANLDPFGPGVRYELVQRLGKNAASEVLVTFMSDWLIRFAELEEIDDGDLQFGTTHWREVAHLGSPDEKELFLVDEYRSTLARAGLGLTARFKLSDDGGHSFYLIYGTSHRRGLERMKESMWKIDPVSGVQFKDPSDPDQGVLDFGKPKPDLTPIVRQLRRHLQKTEAHELTLDELRHFTLEGTAFRPPHANAVVRRMLKAGELRRDPEKGRLSGTVRLRLA